MRPLSLADIANKIGATYTGPADAAVPAVSTDTRALPPGCLFVALRGENFDGNEYVAQALADGAVCAVAERAADGADPAKVLIVPDTRAALMQIANLYRRELGVTVVAVTGSVGKTTTKEMVACVLGARFKTLKTEQNLNNEIGVSQMILRLEEAHEAAVLELGIDGPGQMRPLSECAEPDVAVLTNIGVSHIEQLGSREGILREKLDVTAGLRKGGTLILNADDDMLATVDGTDYGVLRYSLTDASADACARNISEYATHTTFEVLYQDSRFDAKIPSLGRHNVANALAAFLAGVHLGVEPRAAIAALSGYRPAGMRQNIVKHGEFTVVEDCYNASPDSMLAALSTLGKLTCDGKRIAVLSDMLELGEIAEASHFEVGRAAATCGADVLLCTGELSRKIHAGAAQAGMQSAHHFADKDTLFAHLKDIIRPGDVVWFKASRGMKLEQVIQNVYEEC